MTDEYRFRVRCGICNTETEWVETADAARADRRDHFDAEHPSNPMRKQNAAIQRYPAAEVSQ